MCNVVDEIAVYVFLKTTLLGHKQSNQLKIVLRNHGDFALVKRLIMVERGERMCRIYTIQLMSQ